MPLTVRLNVNGRSKTMDIRKTQIKECVWRESRFCRYFLIVMCYNKEIPIKGGEGDNGKCSLVFTVCTFDTKNHTGWLVILIFV